MAGPDNTEGIHWDEWQTPGGHTAKMCYRGGTSDWNTISACLRNPMADGGDEYHLPTGLTGWALDLGAHVGSVTVGLLLDNPGLRVLAIEAVPENAALIVANLAMNGLSLRAIVWNAAGWDTSGTIDVEWDYSGSEAATVNRYIGSVSPWLFDAPRTHTTVKSVTLEDALAVTDGGFVWVKADCEGCEHKFFQGDLSRIGHLEGEWHERDGTADGLVAAFAPTHETTWSQGIGGGPFRAVPR